MIMNDRRVVVLAMLGVALANGPTHAQQPDTLDAVPLRPVVVTVERSPWPITVSAASVSQLDQADIAVYPQVTLADVLRQLPGIALVDFSGDGNMPQPIVRGFYGGGEAEYVVVLLDGRPLNDVQAGLVRWDAIPMVAIDRIEMVRGGASALYGDAAVGAVLNVITRDPLAASAPIWSVAGGSNTTIDASLYAAEEVFGRPASVFAGLDRTEGFRAHSERSLARAGATYSLTATERAGAEVSALVQWRDYEEPGPLLDSDLGTDRSASDVFYRFDRTKENSQRVGIDARTLIGGAGRLDVSLGADRRNARGARTVALAPFFADTKFRDLTTLRAVGSAVVSVEDSGLPGRDRIVFGLDGAYGDIESEYFAVLSGSRQDYLASDGVVGDLDAAGSGTRSNGSAFAEYTLLPTDAVRVSLGLRADWLRDSFEPTAPSGGESVSASHTAISPKAGINVRWLNTGNQTGHVYVNAGRSFKAPTLDQLFDQRTLPVPFDPFQLTTSNPLLEPQYGTQYEVGLYHSIAIVPSTVGLDLAVSGYRMDMKDEIDFDLATLKYVNIARSRHEGVEASASLSGPRGLSAFVTAAFQEVTARNGENAGKQLKSVPRQVYGAGIAGRPVEPLQLGVSVNHTRGMYLDDANELEHPAYTRVDSRVEVFLPERIGASVFLDVRNLFDAEYSTTGYPDTSGSAAIAPIYYFPAAGRTLKLGLRIGS